MSRLARLYTSVRPRQDFSRVFRKNLVHPVCAIHPILPDGFANGIRRWLFFCEPHPPVAIFANGNAASDGSSAHPAALRHNLALAKLSRRPRAVAVRMLVVGSRKSGLTG